MRSQVRNQLSSHKFPKSIKMKSDHHPLDDSGSIERVREKERKRERNLLWGDHRRRSERSDGRFAASATAADRRPASNSTAYKLYVAGTTVSTSDATAEFREFQRSRSSPSIRLNRGVCRGDVPLYRLGSQVILISEKNEKITKCFFVWYIILNCLQYIICIA